MNTRKLLLLMLSLLMTMGASAAKGDEVWKSIDDWSEYMSHSEFGDIQGMILYDVDADGINECFVVGEYASAFFTCGDGSGKYGKEHIYLAANSIHTSSLSIYKGIPYIAHQGGCGTGCHIFEYYKIDKSSLVSGYQSVETYNPMSEDEEGKEGEYMLLKPGQEPRKISSVLFDKNAPKKAEVINLEELDMIAIESKMEEEPVPAIAGAKATLHYQSADTTIIRDDNGYFYAILSNGELAVAPGGAYSGDIVIPSAVEYEGKTYPVTTVRRNTFYKTPAASNIGTITSITLPASVTLVGADAFRDNPSLTAVNCSPKTRIEVRSFWGCPKLKFDRLEPVYAYTASYDMESAPMSEQINAMSVYYFPIDEANDTIAAYQWALHKYHHNGVRFSKWANMKNDRAMAAYCWRTSLVRGGIFNLINKNNVETMFKGNMGPCTEVLLADNSYVATHEFPMFSRWLWGEDEKPAPEAFKQAMAKKYGKKVKYSYEVGKLLYTTNEQLIITEFAITNHEAQYVLSWLKDGKEICTFTEKQKTDPEYEEYSVWNVDDDGNYNIPTLMTVARDEKGNIELFLLHAAPESLNFSHLVQKGNKFESVGGDQWYNWIDAPDD